MWFRKSEKKLDKDILLRSYIAQGIKTLYFDRKHFFSEQNKDYEKLKETLDYVSNKIENLIGDHPRMLIPSNNGFYYETLDKAMADKIVSFLNFLVELPPPSFKLITKWKKSADIGMMHVPTLTFILYSTLEYKVPDHNIVMMENYASISAAILEILRESSVNSRVREISEQLSKKFNGKIDNVITDTYKKNIIEWKKLGLLI